MRSKQYNATITAGLFLFSLAMGGLFQTAAAHEVQSGLLYELFLYALTIPMVCGFAAAIAFKPELYAPIDAVLLGGRGSVAGFAGFMLGAGGVGDPATTALCAILVAIYAGWFAFVAQVLFADMEPEGYAPLSRRGLRRARVGVAFQAHRLTRLGHSIARRVRDR